jgi:hypothetical protein
MYVGSEKAWHKDIFHFSSVGFEEWIIIQPNKSEVTEKGGG